MPGSAGYPPFFFTAPYTLNVSASANAIQMSPPFATMKYPTPSAASTVATVCMGVSRSLKNAIPSTMVNSGHR